MCASLRAAHALHEAGVRPGTSRLYGTLEGGGTLARRDDMNAYDVDWIASASLGYRIANWDVRASASLGGMFERAVWMFSLGHDFVRLDSTTTRTNLFP